MTIVMVMMIIVIMATKEVVKLVSWCFESSQPQKDYIRAEHKLQSISKVFIPQIIMQVFFCFVFCFSFSKHSSNSIHNFETQNQKNKHLFWSVFVFREHSTRVYCIQQGDLFHSADLHRNRC